ncbi:MAG: (4Fe-4S)-binding protein [Gammaproteobacteria bacterium]
MDRVRFDPNTCIHAGECVRGLPAIFNLSKDSWIDIYSASMQAIIEQ